MSFEHFLAVDHYNDLVIDWLTEIVEGRQPLPDSLRVAYQRSPQAGDDYHEWAGP